MREMAYCRAMPLSPHPSRIKSDRIKAIPSAAPGFAPEFVAAVLEDALRHTCRVYAIAGLQGSGKSTLSAQVATLARTRGLSVVVLSLDDVYLGPRARQALARRVHPLLATRGPPGTHDLALACATLDALREGRRVRLPRFDKATDRRLPPSRWPWIAHADLVLFEGWCLKTPAQREHDLSRPLNTLERREDPDGVWRDYCNRALRDEYPTLWAGLDRLLFLQPPDFAPVARWRWQQERRLHAARPGQRTMSRTEVLRFVQLFERVSRQALTTLPAIADWTVRLDAERRPQPITRPRN